MVLRRSSLDQNPVIEFGKWLKLAEGEPSIKFPDAMALSTIDEAGFPDSRMVLLKGFDESGFVFYTSLTSEKGKSLLTLPRAALLFYWDPLERQVRVQGSTELVTDEEADEYFSTRPRLSQLGAWASRQSEFLENRSKLEQRFVEAKRRFESRRVLRPAYWTGFRLLPVKFEFWMLGADRLHDRFRYTKSPNGWHLERLYP